MTFGSRPSARRAARISIMAGRIAPGPNKLKQTEKAKNKTLADGAGRKLIAVSDLYRRADRPSCATRHQVQDGACRRRCCSALSAFPAFVEDAQLAACTNLWIQCRHDLPDRVELAFV